MNMNKALQDLYYAVSGSTTTKRNITKLLLDIHYAITGKESDNKNNHSRIVESLAQNWPSGGGGSSDFSTAEVTFVNNTGEDMAIWAFPHCVEAGEVGEGAPAMIFDDGITISSGGSSEVVVPLYKGGLSFSIDLSQTYTVDGDVTYFGGGQFYITGNGTITIS